MISIQRMRMISQSMRKLSQRKLADLQAGTELLENRTKSWALAGRAKDQLYRSNKSRRKSQNKKILLIIPRDVLVDRGEIKITQLSKLYQKKFKARLASEPNQLEMHRSQR
jgi:hypothetical protein